MNSMSDGEAISPEGLEALKAEIQRLEEVEGDPRDRRPHPHRARVGRPQGERRVPLAKKDQSLLETNIKRLDQRLRAAVVVDTPTAGDASGSAQGPRARRADRGKATWTLVGATEADLSPGKLSTESPVARA